MSFVTLVVLLSVALIAGQTYTARDTTATSQVRPGNSHSIILPGIVEFKGSAAVPQHRLDGPPPGNTADQNKDNSAHALTGNHGHGTTTQQCKSTLSQDYDENAGQSRAAAR
jgi:hypothetical protein